MNKIWIIIQREYITRVKRKSFIITTLLAPLGFFALIAGSVLISTYPQGRTDVAIVDESGLFRDVSFADAEDQTVYFHRVDDKYDQLATSLPKDKGENKKYSAIIYIPAGFNINNPNNPVIAYRYVERPGVMKKQFINDRMNEAVDKLRMKMLNINEDVQKRMQTKTQLDFSSLEDITEKKGYTEAAGIAGMVMGFAIYISLFFYGTMIMKGVQEEKTNRIIEVLTSSVKPFQLLMGKIIGVGAVGLTQFILWIVLIFGVNIVAGVIFGAAFHPQPMGGMGNVPAGGMDADEMQLIVNNISTLPFTQIMIFFPIYFLGGFLLYGSLFAAIGAAIGEDGDQQSLMIPVTVPIIISILIAVNVINNPDSSLGFWGSIIPFTSPVVMSALLPFRPVWWQIALSLGLLIGGFILTTYIAAKIYRIGILMYGKKVTFKEMVRWIFARN
ncbi:MAG TPA: ABC transporter permease [Chitinophagales bacterium]|nr:ABC transporter permease [Chitinophagales bacterium]